MKSQLIKQLVCAAMVASLAACAVPNNSASSYKAREAQSEQTVRMAVVDSVREVSIDKGQSGVGAATGAVLGGLAAGANIGGGNGAIAAGVVGAVLGGIAGQHVEANMKNRKGYEITVRLDNGEMRAITQDADESFQPGDRVRLLSSGRTTRVTH